MKKRLARIGIIIIAVLIVVTLIRDALIEHAVEKAGSFLLGTRVEIGSFSSSLLGRVRIRNLTVANPPGYNNPQAFELKEIRVGINLASLFSDKIEISEISVNGMNVDYELKLRSSNLGEIQQNLSRFSSTEETEKEETVDQEADSKTAEKQAVIRLLQISGCSLSFSNSALGITTRMPLPEIRMENLGDGQPISETLNELFNVILVSAGKVANEVGNTLSEAAGEAGRNLGKAAGEVGKNLSGAASEAGRNLSGAADEAGNAIGGAVKDIGDSVRKLFK